MSSSSVKRSGSGSVSESKADLVSVEMNHQDPPSNLPPSAGASSRKISLPTNITFSTSTWSQRTYLEKLLIVLASVLFLVLLAVLAVAVAGQASASKKSASKPSASASASEKQTCTTPACIAAAHGLLQNMDADVDPCEDFYQYACGGFEKRVRIPDDRSSRSQFALIDDDLDDQLRDLLESEDATESSATESSSASSESVVFRQARDQYRACMDLERLEQIGIEPLKQMLQTFGGWPVLQGEDWDEDKFDWRELTYLFRKHGYSTDYLFDFSIGTDIKNSSSRTIYFDQAHLGMSREYLIKGLEDEDVGHYFNYMKKVAVLLGADPSAAHEQLHESLQFEIRLALASLPREERRNASKLYHPMQLGQMGEKVADLLNWHDYVNRLLTEELLQVPPTERVIVSTPGFLRNLTSLLEAEPKRNVANYLLWRAARASIGFLNKAAREVQEEFARNITGKKDTVPRWKSCVGSASSAFSAAVGKMYVLKHFEHEAKEVMLEMVADIREEFSRILDEISWMDPLTRERAHDKLGAIKEYIAYPEEMLLDENLEELYDGLQINSTHYFQNGISMSIWSTNYHWKRLREKVDKTDWKRHADPAVVNAFYSSIENSIQFPAGILQGNFFNKDRPTYMNYGGIGWVIGHEITHGFDDQGRQYDADGNLKNWWQAETRQEFVAKTQCIVWQYGNYTAKSVGEKLNGINTQGENIADNGGLKEAYRAYNRWVTRHGEEPVLPGLDFSPKQLFWLSAANTWCSKYRPKSLEKRIKTGVHSPGMFRVIGPFSNSKDFARDFQCRLGSGMNPVKKCEVW